MTAEHSDSIRQIIRDSLGAETVSVGISTDAIDGITPQAVVSPRSANELSRLLFLADQHKLTVAPRSGGTQLSLGNRLRDLDVVADLSALNRIVQHNAADLTLVVEAGITLASPRSALATKGQFLPLDAPLSERATIGGTLAAGVSGPLKWQYGSARDLVIGMKVAQADGRITQSGGNVVKNVSGYDMARLHVGGLGTLGIITEVSFKLTPLPRHETTLLARFDSVEECMNVAIRIFNSNVMPIAMTAFSAIVANTIASPGGRADMYALAVRLGGRPRTLRRMENEAYFVIRERTDRIDRMEEDSGALWSRLADFGYSERDEAVMSARIATLPSESLEVIEQLSKIGDAAILVQPGYGMMNVHWFGAEADLPDVVSDARDIVHRLGGSLIVERAPLNVKDSVDIWDYSGESLEVMRRLKAQYDPNGILNPNRFIGGI